MEKKAEIKSWADLINETQHGRTRKVSLEHAEEKSVVDRPDPVWSFHHYVCKNDIICDM